MASTTKPTIAFYGATGGSTLAALVPALNAGYSCTALARTPTKLTTMLLEKGVSQSTIDTHLTITTGDVLKISDCKGPLTLNGQGVDMIISGIGQYTMSKQTLCGDAISNILSALSSLSPSKKPLLIALSTTGISSGPRDVPLLFWPLYHIFLARAHEDKRRMEGLIVDEAGKGERGVIRGFVITRASLLTEGKALGSAQIRAGTEGAPAVGYTISREDVGGWVWENLVRREGEGFVGGKVSVTY